MFDIRTVPDLTTAAESQPYIVPAAEQPLVDERFYERAMRDVRAAELATMFHGTLLPLLVQVRQDFLDKDAGELINGCSTWGEYCSNVLHYSESHVRRLIAGNNPATAKHDGSTKRKSPATEPTGEAAASAEPTESEPEALRQQQREICKPISDRRDLFEGWKLITGGVTDSNTLLYDLTLEGLTPKAIAQVVALLGQKDARPPATDLTVVQAKPEPAPTKPTAAAEMPSRAAENTPTVAGDEANQQCLSAAGFVYRDEAAALKFEAQHYPYFVIRLTKGKHKGKYLVDDRGKTSPEIFDAFRLPVEKEFFMARFRYLDIDASLAEGEIEVIRVEATFATKVMR